MSKKQISIPKEFLIQEYQVKKRSIDDISKELKCDKTIIYKRLKKYGIEVKRRTVFEDQLTKEFLIEQYINLGKSAESISKDFGCGYTAIFLKLKRFGIKRRKNSERTEWSRINESNSIKRVYRDEKGNLIRHGYRYGKTKFDKTIKIPCACGCGEMIFKYDKKCRERKFVSGHGNAKNLVLQKNREDKVFCACGCGTLINKYVGRYEIKFVKGHIWIGRKHSKQTLKKMSESQNKKLDNEEYKKFINSKEMKEKLSKISKERWKDENFRKIHSESEKKSWDNSDRRKNFSLLMKERWKDNEYKKKTLAKIIKKKIEKPTSYESKISELCIKYHLPFIYTGNGTFFIGTKNPDFIHKDKEKRIAIEVFHPFFKIKDYGSVEEYIKQRSEYFVRYGYKTIFIQSDETKNKNWEGLCLNKINEFIK